MDGSTHGDARPNKTWSLEIKPRSQQRVFLGELTSDMSDVQKGFEITITPDIVPDDAVVSQVLLLEDKGKKKFYLHIENFDDRTVGVHIRQL